MYRPGFAVSTPQQATVPNVGSLQLPPIASIMAGRLERVETDPLPHPLIQSSALKN